MVKYELKSAAFNRIWDFLSPFSEAPLVSYFWGMLFVLITASTAMAGFTNFDDLPLGAIYGPGDVITSNGLQFQAVSLGQGSIKVQTENAFYAGGFGTELILGTTSSGLDLWFPYTRNSSRCCTLQAPQRPDLISMVFQLRQQPISVCSMVPLSVVFRLP